MIWQSYAIYTRPLSVRAQYSRLCPISGSFRYNGSLVTWTVVCLTAAKFKPLVFSVTGFALSNGANIFHYHDFVWPLLVACIILLCTLSVLVLCPLIIPRHRLHGKHMSRVITYARLLVRCLATSCSTVHREHGSYYCVCRWNVYTESLPRNGHARPNTVRRGWRSRSPRGESRRRTRWGRKRRRRRKKRGAGE
jgi:hypothetical protein